MQEYYSNLTGRGMKKMMALIAVARKLLRVIFAIVRDNSEYMADYAMTRKVIKKAA